MLDLRNAGMGLLASGSLLLAAPVTPDSCTGTDPGAGGVGGGAGADAFCGNGRQEGNELCDGADLGNLTSDCTRYDSSGYFTGGTLGCTEFCNYDVSRCTHPVCGDGQLDEKWEACDGSQFRAGLSRACTDHSASFLGGTATCGSDCQLDFGACVSPVCGDGKIEGLEQCDGSTFIQAYAGKSCDDIPYPYPLFPLIPTTYTGGALRCGSDCNVSLAECRVRPGCYVMPRFGVQCY